MSPKIAINGFGRLGRSVANVMLSGADNYKTCTKEEKFLSDFDYKAVWEKHDSLVKAYKAVRSKYYPEKDLYKL